MASLKDLLRRTFLFTAAHDSGNTSIYKQRLAPDAPMECTPLGPHDRAIPPSEYRVWSWKHDPQTPAKVTNLTARMRTSKNEMVMPVCESIEVQYVRVTLPPEITPSAKAIELPLSKDYVLSKYKLESGRIRGDFGWWRLPADVDQSLLVVFGYELRDGTPRPLIFTNVEEMGKRFFPRPALLDEYDPDAFTGSYSTQNRGSDAIIVGDEPGDISVSNPFVIIAFGFSTCKERSDFFPGNILGTGRVYPHVMVSCNTDLLKVETSLAIVRSETAAKCGDEPENMKDEMGTILMADTNSSHALTTELDTMKTQAIDRVAGHHVPLPSFLTLPPIPLWSNFFDYYDLHPERNQDYLVVNPAAVKRSIENGILREARDGGYEKDSPFWKLARQGAYDNIHVAPKMRLKLKTLRPVDSFTNETLNDITMAPFCIHDCLHMHFRWGTLVRPDDNPDQNTIISGFDGRKPNAAWGAPMVPEDQAVWIRLTKPSSFTYRAETTKRATRGTWTVFVHHGMGYALSVASETKIYLARKGVETAVQQRGEPLTSVVGGDDHDFPVPVIDDIDPMTTWAAFYWRLQFKGSSRPHKVEPRIKILSLERCRDK